MTMTKIGKFWTAGIAYVALAVGAGLSIMYNVVDTMAVRGPRLDVFDIVTAVAAPAIVVLMVELFVSNWWVGAEWPLQALRWLGCLVIGGVAMRASWTHGHDFMATRGQTGDVAISWPLAIDLLAVMATALILVGRRARMSADTDTDTSARPRTLTADTMATGVAADTDMVTEARSYTWVPRADTDMAADEDAAMSAGMQGLADASARDRWADLIKPAADTDTAKLNDLATWASWTSADDQALRELSTDVDRGTDTPDVHLMSGLTRERPDALPQRTRTPGSATTWPMAFSALVLAWEPDQLERADMVKLSAAYFGVSTRTVRRWLAAALNEPISGA